MYFSRIGTVLACILMCASVSRIKCGTSVRLECSPQDKHNLTCFSNITVTTKCEKKIDVCLLCYVIAKPVNEHDCQQEECCQFINYSTDLGGYLRVETCQFGLKRECQNMTNLLDECDVTSTLDGLEDPSKNVTVNVLRNNNTLKSNTSFNLSKLNNSVVCSSSPPLSSTTATISKDFSTSFYDTLHRSSIRPEAVCSTPSLLKTISSRAPYKSPATYSIFSESSSPQTSSMEEQLTPLYITVGCLVGFSVLLVSIMFFSWTILIIMRKRRNKMKNINENIAAFTELNQDSKTTNADEDGLNIYLPRRSQGLEISTVVNDQNICSNQKVHDDIFQVQIEKSLKSCEGNERFHHWKVIFSSVMINRNDIEICEKPSLGEGAFGKVSLGILNVIHEQNDCENRQSTVAVKSLKGNPSSDQIEEFLSESAIMLDFNHPNVLKLIGVCFDNEKGLPFILLPYMANGDLKTFLRNKRRMGAQCNNKEFPEGLTHSTLVFICLDIAHGMEYLAKKRFVHRDLAARNCLIDDDLCVKISDFGLSRDVYSKQYYRMGLKTTKLPIKWLPPESLHDNVYSEKSDIWAFGVTCWEVFSLGRSPYPSFDNAEVLEHIESGHRLKKPSLCTKEMYRIMQSCWQLDPENRPFFTDVVRLLCVMQRDFQKCIESDEDGVNHSYFLLEETSAIIKRLSTKMTEVNNLKEENAQKFLSNSVGDSPFPQPYTLPVNTTYEQSYP